jgi:hypothetical protein
MSDELVHGLEIAKQLFTLLKPGLLAIVWILFGWWLSYYFQAAKIFFDSKRVACEHLISHFAGLLALASQWAEAHPRMDIQTPLLQQFNRKVENTWSLIGQLTMYARPWLANEFIQFNNRLIQLMESFERNDQTARAILLQEGESWNNFREHEVFPMINRLRRHLIRSALFPWVIW